MEEVDQFIAITGAQAADAQRCLEAAGGDLGEAIELFYAEGPSGAAAPSAAAAQPSRPATRKPAAPRGGIRGLGDLQAEEESEDDDDFNDYYVGGEKSGQMVRGAPKKDKDPKDVDNLFESARQAGAEDYRPSEPQQVAGGVRAFGGRARTLAGGSVEPEEEEEEAGNGAQERSVTVAFYRNGVFTIDDGEPRDVSDPSNFGFMNAIARGQMPPELDPGDPNILVNVNLVRKDEDYAPPARPKYTAFTGSGRKLGGEDYEPAPSAAAPSPAPSGAATKWEVADPDKPKTSIQLRLSDGSRMVAEFNLSHTVGDIRSFIRASRPDMTTSYRLMTAFPSAQLEDDGATIEAAGLANAVVIQK